MLAEQHVDDATAADGGFQHHHARVIGDYFAVQATIPFRRYSFAFDAPTGSSFMYRAATDMYYGLVAGVAVLTK